MDADLGATVRWGSQLDLAVAPTPAEDILELDYEEDDEVISELLVSKDHNYDDEIFIPSTQAAKPGILSLSWDEEERVTTVPAVHVTVCKCVASRLNILWSSVVKETTRSCTKEFFFTKQILSTENYHSCMAFYLESEILNSLLLFHYHNTCRFFNSSQPSNRIYVKTNYFSV